MTGMEATAMKGPNVLVKLFALASSVLLVAGCISYRAGWLREKPAVSPSGPTAERPRLSAPPAGAEAPETMDSTKSINFGRWLSGAGPDRPAEQAAQSGTGTSQVPAEEPPPTLMFGTKSDSGLSGGIIFNQRPASQQGSSGPKTNSK